MSKKLLLDAIGLLLIALVVVVGYKLSPLLLPPADRTVMPDAACNLQRQPLCAAVLPEGGRVELSMGTQPVPMITPFMVKLRVTGFVPDRVIVDFSGVDMNMGLNRREMVRRADASYEAEMSLPVCVTGQMDWQVTLLLERGKERLAIPYRLITSGENK